MLQTNNIEYDTIVLSGASTKGILILGSLQLLQDQHLINNVSNFIGTSSGSMICYLLCIGYTPIEILVFMCTNNLLSKMQTFNMVDLIQGNGATSFHPIHEAIEKMTIDKIGYLPTIKNIKENFGKNLIIVTHNISEDKTEYISVDNYPDIPCLVAIRMSANIPLIFDHYKYGSSFYIDGGISDNFPIQIGDKIGKRIIGLNLDSGHSDKQKITDLETLEYFYKLILIPVSQAVSYKIEQASNNCDIINITSNKDLKIFDFNLNSKIIMDMFSSGYNIAEEFIKEKQVSKDETQDETSKDETQDETQDETYKDETSKDETSKDETSKDETHNETSTYNDKLV